MPNILHRLSIDAPPERVHQLAATREGIERWWTGRPVAGAVEESSFANIPATKVCMNCHSEMWAVAPILNPYARVIAVANRSSGPGCTTYLSLSISITAFT